MIKDENRVKPKLIVVTSTFPRWFNDTDPPFVYELSKRLIDTFDITVHAPHYPEAKTKEVVEGLNIHRFRYFWEPFEKLAGSIGILPTLRHNKLYYGLVPFFLLAQFASLLLLVWKIRPDVIHAHWIIPQGFLSVLVKIIYNTPVVITAHGSDIFGLQGLLYKLIKRFALKRAAAVTVVSSPLGEALVSIIPSVRQLQIIPMGVDSTDFSPDTKNEYVREIYNIHDQFLLFVGRLTEVKGVQYLIEAMPFVLQDMPSAKLLIVGSGELEDTLKKQVEISGLNEQIVFAGNVPNMELSSYYATADIFIGPSIVTKSGDTEGFGLTFVEASMAGCLIIGTDTGGIKDVIQNGKTGFLVPEKSSAAIAKTILYALRHGHKVNSLKAKSRKRCIENFDWNVIVRKYTNLLIQCGE